MPVGKSVLDGVTVLELCEVFQGPVAAQSLGDFGARVIKIERGPRGDPLRGSDVHAAAKGEMSSHFAAANRNKQSICLDLKSEAGREALRRLAAKADVLMHNYRPGVMDRLGLGYDALSAINPGLIYASGSGFGESGPWADLPGQDLLIQSVSGIASRGQDRPNYVNAPLTDFASGMLLVQGVLMALIARARTGRGQRITVSLMDAAIAIQGLEAASVLNHGAVTSWMDLAPNFPIRTADGWLTILGFFRDNPLRLICEALEIDDLSAEMGAATAAEQLARRPEIVARLEPHFAKITNAQALDGLRKVSILAAPVLNFADTMALPQVAANAMLTSVPVDGQEPIRVLNQPLRMSDTPSHIERGPPHLGQHNEEILREVGFDSAQIRAATGG
ncbi:CoA transferase [Sphingobium yanoikuyae]|uniref:CoA transferase n=1 Tax=Sphingobium yanoikuyae TaxID=13690 RepID=A0A9X7UJD2_SPHYA|nr:CoA transferase [Sphingobium yanoikuyae]